MAIKKKVEEVVKVDTSVVPEVVAEPKVVDDSKKPAEQVKIKMREDHDCTIAKVRYNLHKGKVYIVPANVKRILESHGLLSPLN